MASGGTVLILEKAVFSFHKLNSELWLLFCSLDLLAFYKEEETLIIITPFNKKLDGWVFPEGQWDGMTHIQDGNFWAFSQNLQIYKQVLFWFSLILAVFMMTECAFCFQEAQNIADECQL